MQNNPQQPDPERLPDSAMDIWPDIKLNVEIAISIADKELTISEIVTNIVSGSTNHDGQVLLINLKNRALKAGDIAKLNGLSDYDLLIRYLENKLEDMVGEKYLIKIGDKYLATENYVELAKKRKGTPNN